MGSFSVFLRGKVSTSLKVLAWTAGRGGLIVFWGGLFSEKRAIIFSGKRAISFLKKGQSFFLGEAVPLIKTMTYLIGIFHQKLTKINVNCLLFISLSHNSILALHSKGQKIKTIKLWKSVNFRWVAHLVPFPFLNFMSFLNFIF